MDIASSDDVRPHVPELGDILWFYGATTTRRTYLEVLYHLGRSKESMREVSTAALYDPSETPEAAPALLDFNDALELLTLHRQQLAWECRGVRRPTKL